MQHTIIDLSVKHVADYVVINTALLKTFLNESYHTDDECTLFSCLVSGAINS